MGLPIQVGDKFGDYESIRTFTTEFLVNRRGATPNSNESFYSTKKFALSTSSRVIATGTQYGKKATINIDWLNGTHSIYCTEYKPENFKQDTWNPKFTTIYDFGCDDNTGKNYYLKAVDLNGNNIVDENEIKYFNSEKEMWGSQDN